MQELIKAKAIELLENGTVDRVLGWKAGEFFYDLTPAVFTSRRRSRRTLSTLFFPARTFPSILSRRAARTARWLHF